MASMIGKGAAKGKACSGIQTCRRQRARPSTPLHVHRLTITYRSACERYIESASSKQGQMVLIILIEATACTVMTSPSQGKMGMGCAIASVSASEIEDL